jgi:hypothetical protein
VVQFLTGKIHAFQSEILSVAFGVVLYKGNGWISLRKDFHGLQCISIHTRCLDSTWIQFPQLVVQFLKEVHGIHLDIISVTCGAVPDRGDAWI